MDATPFRELIEIVQADAAECERLAQMSPDARSALLLSSRASKLRRIAGQAEAEILRHA